MKWTKEEENILKECYKLSNGVEKAYKIFNTRSKETVRQKAYKMGIKNMNFYKNENFFEIPNITNSSVAGMIASDGHLNYRKNRYQVDIYQKTADEEILNQIKVVTYSNYNIYRKIEKGGRIIGKNKKPIIKDSYGSILYFCKAEKWCQDLNKNWNIPIGHKSYTLEGPKNLNDLDNKLAYICGIISGDGSIGISKNKFGGILHISIWGTFSLLQWCKNTFSEYLKRELKMDLYKEEESKSCYCLKINSFNAIQLFEKMRSFNCIKLKRKWDNPKILDLIENKKKSMKYQKRIERFLVAQSSN